VLLTTDVVFGLDAADLSGAARAELEAAAAAAGGDADSAIMLTVFVPTTGDPAYNAELADRRLEAVADELRELGIEETRLIMSQASVGARQGGLLGVAGAAGGVARDRRVEIRVVGRASEG
jgi:outer membrane protein OmpA-like peptidoglycan-associated protein